MLGMQAFANTALWNRLTAEQRLLKGVGITEVEIRDTLMNFTPTRPVAEIAKEYVEGFWTLYESLTTSGAAFNNASTLFPRAKADHAFAPGKAVRLVAQLIWHQGWRRPEIRVQFWRQLWVIVRTKPQVLNMYLGLCCWRAFLGYRALARERITQQLGYDPVQCLRQQKNAQSHDMVMTCIIGLNGLIQREDSLSSFHLVSPRAT